MYFILYFLTVLLFFLFIFCCDQFRVLLIPPIFTNRFYLPYSFIVVCFMVGFGGIGSPPKIPPYGTVTPPSSPPTPPPPPSSVLPDSRFLLFGFIRASYGEARGKMSVGEKDNNTFTTANVFLCMYTCMFSRNPGETMLKVSIPKATDSSRQTCTAKQYSILE